MKPKMRVGTVLAVLCWFAGAQAQNTVDPQARVKVPAFEMPYSPLASPEARQNFLDTATFLREMRAAPGLQVGSPTEQVLAGRKYLDEHVFGPQLARLRRVFSVQVKQESIGGVQTDVVLPADGISKTNASRVLINLHGGSFAVGARLGGQMESVPIASLGRIKVVAVDYRMWPEHHFPAASEDVAKVYAELLKEYRPENIGIYGCSAGSLLAAEAVAWFQKHQLPRPGAIGMFGAGALLTAGDSNYMGAVVAGFPVPTAETNDEKKSNAYFDLPTIDMRDPLVSPAYSAAVLAQFPPTLLISGTRDLWMSGVVYTHAKLVKAGVDARLHLWEGATHCEFAQPIVDPNQPESREAWSVIVKFFDSSLGHAKGSGSTAHDPKIKQ